MIVQNISHFRIIGINIPTALISYGEVCSLLLLNMDIFKFIGIVLKKRHATTKLNPTSIIFLKNFKA